MPSNFVFILLQSVIAIKQNSPRSIKYSGNRSGNLKYTFYTYYLTFAVFESSYMKCNKEINVNIAIDKSSRKITILILYDSNLYNQTESYKNCVLWYEFVLCKLHHSFWFMIQNMMCLMICIVESYWNWNQFSMENPSISRKPSNQTGIV